MSSNKRSVLLFLPLQIIKVLKLTQCKDESSRERNRSNHKLFIELIKEEENGYFWKMKKIFQRIRSDYI